MRVREESNLMDMNPEWRPRLDRRQPGLQLFQPFLRPLPDELGRDVQVLRGAPADLRQGTQAIEQLLHILQNIRWQVDSDKETHESTEYRKNQLATDKHG